MIGQISKLAPELPLDDFYRDFGTNPDKVIVPEERFWKEFAAEYYSENNWAAIPCGIEIVCGWSMDFFTH